MIARSPSSPRWYRLTTKSAWMKGASKGHWFLIGNFLGRQGAWPTSLQCDTVKGTVCGSSRRPGLSPPGTKWSAAAGHEDQRAVGASFHLLGISTSTVEKIRVCLGAAEHSRRGSCHLATDYVSPVSAQFPQFPQGRVYVVPPHPNPPGKTKIREKMATLGNISQK